MKKLHQFEGVKEIYVHAAGCHDVISIARGGICLSSYTLCNHGIACALRLGPTQPVISTSGDDK